MGGNKTMEKEKIKEILLKKAPQKKLPCKLAFEIAKEYEIELKEIGEVANEIGVKISNCQLGCFK